MSGAPSDCGHHTIAIGAAGNAVRFVLSDGIPRLASLALMVTTEPPRRIKVTRLHAAMNCVVE